MVILWFVKGALVVIMSYECSISCATYNSMGNKKKTGWRCENCREKRRPKEDDPPSIESLKNPSDTLKISSEISEIKSILVGLSEQMRGVVQSQQFLSVQYDDIKSSQDRIGSQLEQVEKRMGEITEREQVRDTEIEELSRRVALLEQGDNDRKLELHGVDEIPGMNIEEIIFEITSWKLN
ncbi:hypothetical protein Trydic_g1794 [Trypoxylus dichotomus]